jgi:heme oxygenase
MELLRDSTAALHTSAEANEFQHQLGTGKVDKANFSRYLQQLYLMHKQIADLLDETKPASPAVNHVVKDYHLDLSCISKDLAFFGLEPASSKPLKATEELMDSMKSTAKQETSALLGYLYVLEGSTNGAKFLAKALRAGLDLPEDAGATYFDRYGNEQRERWNAFKTAMNELDFSEKEREALVDRAKETFASFGKIGEELLSRN